MESAHTSLVDHPISQPSGHLSHLDSHYCSRSQKIRTPSIVDYVCKLCFYVGTIQIISHFSDDFHSDSTLILTIAVKQCMNISDRPYVCGVFNDFNVCLNSGRWFMLCLACIPSLLLMLVPGDSD
jgi:hypothetical protein